MDRQVDGSQMLRHFKIQPNESGWKRSWVLDPRCTVKTCSTHLCHRLIQICLKKKVGSTENYWNKRGKRSFSLYVYSMGPLTPSPHDLPHNDLTPSHKRAWRLAPHGWKSLAAYVCMHKCECVRPACGQCCVCLGHSSGSFAVHIHSQLISNSCWKRHTPPHSQALRKNIKCVQMQSLVRLPTPEQTSQWL